MRHLNGGTGSGHHVALKRERGKPKEHQIGIDLSNQPVVLSQQSIVSLTKTSTKEGYTKLFRTAYELAMNLTISLAQFIPRNICFAVIREIKSPRNIWKKGEICHFFQKTRCPQNTGS